MTPELLAGCTGARPDRARLLAPYITAAMEEFGIDKTPLRQASFLAQVAHESGSFKWMKELWGPTGAQRRYEPPGTLATKLGNTQPGDGKRYMGRGPIQVTGRANYRAMGTKLGVDLEQFPELLDEPGLACRAAGAFWDSRGLNALADAGQQVAICHKVNGGENGLDDRLDHYRVACAALGIEALETDSES